MTPSLILLLPNTAFELIQPGYFMFNIKFSGITNKSRVPLESIKIALFLEIFTLR